MGYNTQTRLQLLEMIREDPYVSIKRLSDLLGTLNLDNVRYHIRQLEESGLVQYKGNLYPALSRNTVKRKRKIEKKRTKRLTPQQLERNIQAVVAKAEDRTAHWAGGWVLRKHSR